MNRLYAQNAHWAKPNGVVLRMMLVAIIQRKFHWHCLLKMAWHNRHESYVFEELGGYRAWIWYVWQWMADYIEYEPHKCEYCGL
jgi:hypothetical protein